MVAFASNQSGVPKRLRQSIRLRRRAIYKLRDVLLSGFGWQVPHYAKRVADLNRYVQEREWLRDPNFDPIALGC